MLLGLGVVALVVILFLTWKLFSGPRIRIPLTPGFKSFYGHVHLFDGITAANKHKFDETFIKVSDPTFIGSAVGHLKWWFTSEITLSSVKTAEILLKSRTNVEKAYQYDELKRWLMDSVLILPHKAWHTRRKQLTPAFHFAVMENFESIMKKDSQLLVEVIKQDPTRPVVKHILDVTLHTIIETSFGTSFKSLEESKPYLDALNKLLHYIWSKNLLDFLSNCSQWYYYNVTSNGKLEAQAINELNELLMVLVRDRKKELASGETRLYNGRKSFLDHMVELQATEGNLTDEQIVGESNAILVAGHETTTASVSWTLYYLCKNPEMQQRLFEEIDEQLAGRPFSELEINSLVYLHMVVKESLRIQPPVTYVGRKLTETLTVDGWTIPPGTDVDIVLYWIHRDPEFWPEPEKFDPERFSAENSRGRNPYAFVPFSAGPRNCIGQRFASLESRILVAAVIHKFKISTTQELGVDLRRDMTDLTSLPGPDFTIQFQSREQ